MCSTLALALLVLGVPAPGDPASDSAAAPRYDVFEFGFHGPTWTTAFGMNDALEVSGSYGTTANFVQAFVGGGTKFVPFAPIPGYGRAVGVDIDSSARVVLRMWHGQLYQLGIDQHVGVWERGAGPVDLHAAFLGEAGKVAFGGVAPDKSDVYDSNDAGQFAGWMSLGTQWGSPLLGQYVAYRADMEDRSLDPLLVPSTLPPSFADTWARAIDSDGDVVGYAFERVLVYPVVYFQPTAVAWIDGAPLAVGSPDPQALPFSRLIDIDRAGRAVGSAMSNLIDPSKSRAFAWHKSSGRFEWLDPIAGYTGSSVGSCAVGAATGSSARWNSSGGYAESIPTLWQGGAAYSIADIVPAPGPWVILGLGRIDDDGRILSLAHQPPDPTLRNVLLVPRSGLEVDVPRVGLVGHTNTVRVDGATPGARVELLIGFAPTVEPLPGCSSPHAIVGVGSRVLHLPAVLADANGHAQFDFFAPAVFGTVFAVYFQALEPDTCRTGRVATNFFF